MNGRRIGNSGARLRPRLLREHEDEIRLGNAGDEPARRAAEGDRQALAVVVRKEAQRFGQRGVGRDRGKLLAHEVARDDQFPPSRPR